ncbi:MAG: branched-chain amino acid ABC transporter permease [Rhodospirillaceae bacterium]|nr:branched-chain amino acid ABC transporter permease [Rhodospirillaceae bacterium]
MRLPAPRETVPLLLVAAIAAILPVFGSDYYLGVGFALFGWIALVQSWTIVSGLAGYISLGHVVFAGIGGYVLVLTWGAVPVWAGAVLGALAAGLFALLVGLPVLRVRGPYFVILTFGLAEFAKYVVINIENALGKFGRLILGGPQVETLYWAMAAAALAGTLAVIATRRVRLGAGLAAVREDELAAETIGVPTVRFKLFAFALSALLPGFVGALFVLRTGYFEPAQAFDPVISFTIVTMAIIGGSEDARGPVLGALFLVVLSELLWASFPQVYMIILGALLIGFVLFAPNGVAGLLDRLRSTGGARAAT